MFQPRTHTILFFFERPETTVELLLDIFQRIQRLPDFGKSHVALYETQTIVLIGKQTEQSLYLTYMLHASGYRVQLAATPVDAFTLCLREVCVPFVVLIMDEQSVNRFFLVRFLQQAAQKYSWNPPCIMLQTQTSVIPVQEPVHAPATVDASRQTQPHLKALPAPSRVPTSSSPTPIARSLALSPAPHIPEQALHHAEVGQTYVTAPLVQHDMSSAPGPVTGPVIPSHPAPLSPALLPVSPTAHEQAPSFVPSKERVTLTGLSIGRYHMQTLLGSGPLGEVYRTYDRLREHDVALKAVQLDALPSYMNHQDFTSETNIFQQEIDLLKTLKHPNILVPLNCGKSYMSGSPFIYKTMHYCSGGSVAALLYRMGEIHPLSRNEMVHIVVQVADALQFAHNQHIVYQNFKLSNLLIREAVSNIRTCHVLLTDFALIQNGSFLLRTPGVFPYMAPERWYGQSLPASDQYGLAALAYELLTGRQLFSGQSEHVLKQLHMTMQPQSPSTLSREASPAIDAIFRRALAKRPDDRFPTIAMFADALRQAV